MADFKYILCLVTMFHSAVNEMAAVCQEAAS